MLKVLKMDKNMKRYEIINMLQHYWFGKDYFSYSLLEKALEYLKQNQNPFLYIKEEMEKQIEDKGNAHYQLNSNVFYFRLENDNPIKPEEPKLIKKHIIAFNLSNKNLLRCEVCQKYIYIPYNNPKALVLMCSECGEIISFPKVEKELIKMNEEEKQRILNSDGANLYDGFVGSESITVFMGEETNIEIAVDSYIFECEFFKPLDEETTKYVREQLIKYLEENI